MATLDYEDNETLLKVYETGIKNILNEANGYAFIVKNLEHTPSNEKLTEVQRLEKLLGIQ